MKRPMTPEQRKGHAERMRRYRREHPEKTAAALKKYRSSEHGKKVIRERSRRRRAERPDLKRRYDATYRAKVAADPVRRAAQQAYMRAYYDANPDKRPVYSYQPSTDARRETTRRRRARLAGAETFTVDARELRRMRHRQRDCCAYCGKHAELTIEHVIPITRGGRHCIGNLVLACGHCNYSKNARLLIEWRVRTAGRIAA